MSLGKTLILAGAVMVCAGLLLVFGGRLPFRLGQLPGDIVYRGKNTTIYLPITTSVLASLVLTLLFWVFGRK